MTQNTVHTAVARAPLRAALTRLPARAAADPVLLTRVGLVVLGRIRQAFLAKARGGADETGDSWAPLSPRTVAYGRRGRSGAERKRATRPSQALTARQQARWWEVYRRALASFRGDKGHAARVAWFVLKREGATTLLAKYGGRQVEILRDTGVLLNSLSPGTRGGNTAESVFRVEPGAVVVGTNRRGAAAHHRGVPGRLPQRRLWPDPSRWTPAWWADITDQVRQGLLEMATNLIRGTT